MDVNDPLPGIDESANELQFVASRTDRNQKPISAWTAASKKTEPRVAGQFITLNDAFDSSGVETDGEVEPDTLQKPAENARIRSVVGGPIGCEESAQERPTRRNAGEKNNAHSESHLFMLNDAFDGNGSDATIEMLPSSECADSRGSLDI
jgi:hypothetical protein